MTTDAAVRPAGIRAMLGRKVSLVLLSAAAAALLTLGILALVTRGGTPTDPYTEALAPIIANHNAIVARWNGFLTSYNAIDRTRPSEFDARAEEGFDLTSTLAVEAQQVIRAWEQVTPPKGLEEAHRLGAEAIRATQDGFVEISNYFASVRDYGVAFDEMATAGRKRLERAADLWTQARAAAESQPN